MNFEAHLWMEEVIEMLATGVISILIILDYQIVVWVVLIVSVGDSSLIELSVVVVYEVVCKCIAPLFEIFNRFLLNSWVGMDHAQCNQ